MKQLLLYISFAFLAFGCSNSAKREQTTIQNSLSEGIWRAELTLNEGGITLPFNFEVTHQNDSTPQITLLNDTERILLGELTYRGDSLVMPMQVFNTEIVAKQEGSTLSGVWVKKDFKAYRIPFRAQHFDETRFTVTSSNPAANLEGKWQVNFEKEDDTVEEAVGVFKQRGTTLTGTFLTQTGDYRFLEGSVIGDQLRLSCFDGEHAFLFHATITDENTLSEGTFWSGKHWEQAWNAQRDSSASLPDASSLTYLKEGYKRIDFSFPNLEGAMVSLSDEQFKGKVVIVQLMGSWCPNCLDETQFLAPVYDNRNSEGLEIIALAYERLKDTGKIKSRLRNLQDKIGINYPILIAANSNNKLNAAKTLPMLNHVLAYPTTIFIDRQGAVRKIHTGFSGPGTGKYYDTYTREFHLFLDKLLAEGGTL